MNKILLIHGLNSTSNCFNYIKSQINRDFIDINYNSTTSLKEMILTVYNQIDVNDTYDIICHSLGGIIANNLASNVKIDKLISISTPFGGSSSATYLKFFMPSIKILKDITPTSKYILKAQKNTKVSTLNIISTGGSIPMILEPNDSVVSVSSQESYKHSAKVYIQANHSEILQHLETVNYIKQFSES